MMALAGDRVSFARDSLLSANLALQKGVSDRVVDRELLENHHCVVTTRR
jgi:hypothetical protein